MSKCLRRYYDESKKEIVNEVCDFTKSDYKYKFKEWLHGDYQDLYIDEELSSRGIITYVNIVHNSFKDWINYEGVNVYTVLDCDTGEIMPIYIKGDIIFCKNTNRGLPKELTKQDLQYLEAHIKKYMNQIRIFEKETQSDETNYQEEPKEPIDELLKQKEATTALISKYYDTYDQLLSTLHERCDILVSSFKENDQDLLHQASIQLGNMLKDSNEGHDYIRFFKEQVDQSLEHEDDLEKYLIMYLACLDNARYKVIDKKTGDSLNAILDAYRCIYRSREYLKEGYFTYSQEKYNEAERYVNKAMNKAKYTTKKQKEAIQTAKEIDHALITIKNIDQMVYLAK